MMNRFVSNRLCLAFCLFPLSLVAATAYGGNDTGNSKFEVAEIVKLQQRVRAAAADRRALEAYEKSGTEVTHWVEDAAPPSPENAAILYYQAFLLRPDPNEAIREKIHDIFFDAEPDKQLRIYLGHCLPMIRIAERASRIPKCSWAIQQDFEPRFSAKDLHNQVSYLRDVLLVDARTLAADGHYHAALERCLTVRRLARHLSNSSNDGVVLLSRSPDAMALRMIRRVLGIMPPDADMLSWFRGQLAVVQGVQLAFAETLRADFISFLHQMRTNPIRLRHLRHWLTENAEDRQAQAVVQNLTDEELLARVQKPFPSFFDSIFRIAGSEITYEQKLSQMQGLVNSLNETGEADPIVEYAVYISGVPAMIDRVYPLQVGHQAHINATKVAVEVYIVVAGTGKLPHKLPPDLPEDPFTGKDFVYEITDEGFSIRCQGEEFLRRKNKFLEFNIRR
ncbi:MAG: hypothetical protein ACYS7Y_30930 [Planctomycetota bacterium]